MKNIFKFLKTLASDTLKPPDEAETFYNCGLAKMKKGDLDGAINDYAEALRLKPDFTAALSARRFAHGLKKMQKNDLSGAIEDYDKAIQFQPRDALAYYHRGNAKRRKGDLNGAIKDCDAAIQFGSNVIVALARYERHFAYGIVKMNGNDLDGAIKDFTEATRLHFSAEAIRLHFPTEVLRLQPQNAEAYHMRGIAKGDKGDLGGAIADLRKALPLAQAQNWNPEFIKVIEQTIKTLLKKDAQENAVRINNRAIAKEKRGNARGAIKDFTEAIHLWPEYVDAYYNRGLAKLTQKDFIGAIEDLTATINLKPEHANAYRARGSAKHNIGDAASANMDFKKAEELQEKQEEEA